MCQSTMVIKLLMCQCTIIFSGIFFICVCALQFFSNFSVGNISFLFTQVVVALFFDVFAALLILLDDNPLNIYTFPLPQLHGADEHCPHILISNLLPKWLISVRTELFSCEHSHGKEKHVSQVMHHTIPNLAMKHMGF